jgi:hypothetical protein
LSIPDVTVLKHIRVLVQCTDVYANCTSLKQGSVVGDVAHEAFRDLLGMGHYLDLTMLSSIAVGMRLVKWLQATPAPRGTTWDSVTCKGLPYAHLVYVALYELCRSDMKNLTQIVGNLNALLSGSCVRKRGYPVIHLEGGKIGFSYCQMLIPTILAKQKVDLTNISMYQAHVATKLSRDVRTENTSGKGALTRNLYAACNVGAQCADVAYIATNYREVADQFQCIILHEVRKTGAGTAYLHALNSLDYTGTVIIDPRSALVAHLTSKDDKVQPTTYKFKEAPFRVVLIPLEIAMSGGVGNTGYKFPATTIIVDLEYGDFIKVEDNAVVYDNLLSDNFLNQVSIMTKRFFPTITLIKNCNAMTEERDETSDFKIVSTCELHNNMVMVTNAMMKFDDWRLNFKTESKTVYLASLFCNLTRCVVPFTDLLPYVALSKLGIRIPVIHSNVKTIEPQKVTGYNVAFDGERVVSSDANDWFVNGTHADRYSATTSASPSPSSPTPTNAALTPTKPSVVMESLDAAFSF